MAPNGEMPLFGSATSTAAAPHRSIGEVLALLKDEFPDVTISKIRFLESQGLLDPERTPSGYRKFYEPDVDRLKWILRQQRENFLPLKVIKGRLRDAGPTGVPSDEPLAPGEADAVDADDSDALASPRGNGTPRPAASGAPERTAAATGVGVRDRAPEPAPAVARASGAWGEAPAPAPAPAVKPPAEAPRPAAPAATSQPQSQAAPAPAARPTGAGRAAVERVLAALPDEPADAVAHDASGTSMTLDELCSASGLNAEQVADLERFGLLAGRAVAGTTYYDEDGLLVANLAASFKAFGVEARHLRMYRT